tara:strand:- start:48 stop:356 length:309 start_codon:yes stop_codon:yes gene_type:complete
MAMEESYFTAISAEEVTREKRRAKELRRSQWWKNRLASGRCHYCESSFHPGDLTMDHVVPIVRGGRSSKSNVVPCCKQCNSQKQYMLPLEWEAYLKRLARTD